MRYRLSSIFLVGLLISSSALTGEPQFIGEHTVPLHPMAEDRTAYKSKKWNADLYIDKVHDQEGLGYVGTPSTKSDSLIHLKSCTNERILCLMSSLHVLAVPRKIEIGNGQNINGIKTMVKGCLDYDNGVCRKFYVISSCLNYDADFFCTNNNNIKNTYNINIHITHMIFDPDIGVVAFKSSENAEEAVNEIIYEHFLISNVGLLSENFR